VSEELRTDAAAMLDALRATGPLPEYGDRMHAFGQLVGEWEIEDTHFHPDGTPRTTRVGEWLFGWVLEGRAIQDVILSPPRDQQGDGRSPTYEYGTTLRFYDPSIDAWHVAFVAPVSQTVVQLLARVEGDDIVQTGTTPDGKLRRWVFSEISRDSFLWRGNESTDGGSWLLEEEIKARRRIS
jgi:hypothetical protein